MKKLTSDELVNEHFKIANFAMKERMDYIEKARAQLKPDHEILFTIEVDNLDYPQVVGNFDIRCTSRKNFEFYFAEDSKIILEALDLNSKTMRYSVIFWLHDKEKRKILVQSYPFTYPFIRPDILAKA